MKESMIALELEDTEWPFEYTDHDREIARAIVYDDEGYLYFVCASRDDEFGKGSFIETSGGGMEAGETGEEAVRRELKEELGAETEVICELGVVRDYYNLIHRRNINHYYLCRAVSFGEKHLMQDEIEEYHLNTLKLTYDEAVSEYENRRESRLGRLIANREMPVLIYAGEILKKKGGKMEIYKDPSRTVEERVEDLLSKMTLEEKAAQLSGNLAVSFMDNGEVDEEALKEQFSDGHGRFTQYSLTGLVDPVMSAEITNKVQKFFVEKTRLGIPVALQSENLCGYPGNNGTIFPAMINMASTWDPDLMGEVADVIGEESAATGINSAMSPVIDVARDPRWGRMYETFGEDPYLISQMGISYVKNMQKHDIGCIAKHFLGYGTTQGGLNCSAENIGDRELYDVYATSFESAMKEADLSGVMASYSEFDGIPVAANKKIARDLLRDKMGFKGMLTSDGGGVMRLYTTNKVVRSYEEAGLYAIKGGCDTEIPVGMAYRHLPVYVREGKLDESILDDAVRRILTIKFKCGLFEHPYVDVDKVREQMTNASKQALSEKAAEESLVLLKNDGTLPLAGVKKLAVVGPHADSLRYPISGYTYPSYLEMGEASRNAEEKKNISMGGVVDEDRKEEKPTGFEVKKKRGGLASMLDLFSDAQKASMSGMNEYLRANGSKSLKEALEKDYEVSWAEGCTIIGENKEGIKDAVKAAEEADLVIAALGGNCGWVNVTGGEGKDRSHLTLPGVQQDLLDALFDTGKPVVLILYGPGYFSLSESCEKAAAVIQAWMPGPYAGEAAANILTGRTNPGGKLPVTIAKHIGQLPLFYNHKVGSGYLEGAGKEGIFSGGYVDGPADPLFCFGHGLSYTSFELSDFVLSDEAETDGGEITASLAVTNTGSRDGDEVVQLYTRFLDAYVTRPYMQLAAFRRVSVPAGESRRVTFRIKTSQLGYTNEDDIFCVEPGQLSVMIGTASDKIDFTGEVNLKGERVPLKGRRSYSAEVTVE